MSENSVLIISNPVSGNFPGTDYLKNLKSKLINNNKNCEIYLTQFAGDGQNYIFENHYKYNIIVILGGDGTVNEIIQAAKKHSLKIYIIPTGTANVLANEFNLPKKNEINQIIDIINANKTISLQPWLANEKIFLLMLGCGIDSLIVENINLKLKRIIGKGAYVVEFIKQFIKGNFPQIILESKNKSFVFNQIFICNVKKYAGNKILSETSDSSDDIIEIIGLEKINRRKMLWFLFKWSLNLKYMNLNYVKLIKDKKFIIKSKQNHQNIPVQFDGDKGLYLPLKIKINKNKIKLLIK